VPGSGGVDDRLRQEFLAVGEADQERGVVPPGGADPVEAEAGDRHDLGAVAQVGLDLWQVGQGLQVVGGQL
jgi:hypothetical protein